MPILKNSRHEKFCLALVKGMSQTDAAIDAGYKKSRARFTGSELVTYSNIIERRAELSKLAQSSTIMTARQRKERLSEIGNARLSDFIEVDKGGKITSIDIKGAHSGALQEVNVSEFAGGKGQRTRERSTKLKLHNPMQAIDLLNKMEGEYPTVKIDIDFGKPFRELLNRLHGYQEEPAPAIEEAEETTIRAVVVKEEEP